MKRYFVEPPDKRNLKVAATIFIFITILSAHSFHGVSMAPNTLKGWVVTSDTGLVFYTPNCGLNWINQSFLTSRRFYDVLFINEQKGWICSDLGFVFFSSNGGNTWIQQEAGLAKHSGRFFFVNDSCGWLACYGAIVARTTNSGNYWDQIFLPWLSFPGDTVYFHGISFVNKQKGWICAGRYLINDPWHTDTFWGGQGYIAVSNDSGFTWQLLLRDTINDFFDIKMLDSLNGFIIGGNDRTMSATVMKTQDGGVTWQPLSIPSQAHYLRSMKIIGNKIWAVGHSGTILYSNNLGNNWTLQTSPIDTTLYDIDFADTLHGMIAGDGCVLYTHNGGATWNVSNLGIEEETRLPLSADRIPLRVYPNPARTYFTVRIPQDVYPYRADRQELKMYDVTGKVVREITDFAIAHLRYASVSLRMT